MGTTPVAARTGAELQAIVINATCGQCWAYPARPCKLFGQGTELHFARYERAERKGIITEEELKLAQEKKGERNFITWDIEEVKKE